MPRRRKGSWKITHIELGGKVELEGGGYFVEVTAHVGGDDWIRVSRLAVEHLAADAPLTATHLREVPLGQIERLLNLPQNRRRIINAPSEQDLHDWKIPSPSPPGKLRKPKGHRFPHTFYRHVARTYLDAIDRGQPPVQRIAAEAKVPVPTAARWVARARELGELGTAPEGRAGSLPTREGT